MKRLVSSILLILLLSSGVLAQGNGTPPPTYETYIVVQGDTLGRIAAHFGTTTTALMQTNQLVNPNLIYVGELLLIPITATPGSTTSTPSSATFTPTTAPASQASPTLPPS
ncbi:MAG TPA: LysM domain-containing protein, partial [Phototrophicaceae bacterium]|nr:LysM domain-containing protein [Phototrophicaceae bacterium]